MSRLSHASARTRDRLSLLRNDTNMSRKALTKKIGAKVTVAHLASVHTRLRQSHPPPVLEDELSL